MELARDPQDRRSSDGEVEIRRAALQRLPEERVDVDVAVRTFGRRSLHGVDAGSQAARVELELVGIRRMGAGDVVADLSVVVETQERSVEGGDRWIGRALHEVDEIVEAPLLQELHDAGRAGEELDRQ